VIQLVRKGYLKREPRMARGIVIVRNPEDDVSLARFQAKEG
jgi:repressor LexA